MRQALVLLLLTLGAAVPHAEQTPEPLMRGMLVRAAAWLDGLEQQLAVVVCDEHYHQQVGTKRFPEAPKENFRELQSEVVFVWVPQEQMWLTARNVRTVDGEPIDGSSTRVARVLSEASTRLVRMRGLRDESAKFNLGAIYRNFNDPTFTLQFLDRRWQGRFRWTRRGRTRIGKIETWRVDFTEVRQPYVIDADGDRLRSTGSIWIEDRTGAVSRTRLEVWDPKARARARIDVAFAPDAKLGVIVPVRMDEEYGQSSGPVASVIFGKAEYTNFRRFETSGRLVTP